jgi:hypothetical protein
VQILATMTVRFDDACHAPGNRDDLSSNGNSSTDTNANNQPSCLSCGRLAMANCHCS